MKYKNQISGEANIRRNLSGGPISGYWNVEVQRVKEIVENGGIPDFPRCEWNDIEWRTRSLRQYNSRMGLLPEVSTSYGKSLEVEEISKGSWVVYEKDEPQKIISRGTSCAEALINTGHTDCPHVDMKVAKKLGWL
jgi:hypothetical protein